MELTRELDAFTDILTERPEHILRIKINRPQKKNALTTAMYAAMADAMAIALMRGNGEAKGCDTFSDTLDIEPHPLRGTVARPKCGGGFFGDGGHAGWPFGSGAAIHGGFWLRVLCVIGL